jgi:hypothetical protein
MKHGMPDSKAALWMGRAGWIGALTYFGNKSGHSAERATETILNGQYHYGSPNLRAAALQSGLQRHSSIKLSMKKH